MGKSKRISKRSKKTSVTDREVRRKVEAKILKVLREKAQSSEGAILVNDEGKMEQPTENKQKFENVTVQELSDSTPERKDTARKRSRYDSRHRSKKRAVSQHVKSAHFYVNKDAGVHSGKSGRQKDVHGGRITRNRLTRDTGLFSAGMKSEKIVRALPHDEVMREIFRVGEDSDAVSRASASGEPAHEDSADFFSKEVLYKETAERLQRAMTTDDKSFEKGLLDRLHRALERHKQKILSLRALEESRNNADNRVDSRSPSPQLMPVIQHSPKEQATRSLADPPYRPSSSENEESPYPNLVNMPNIRDNLEQTNQRQRRFLYTDCGAESVTGLSSWLNASNLRKASGHDLEGYLQPLPKDSDQEKKREKHGAFDGVEKYSEDQGLDFLTSTEGENHRLELDLQQEEEESQLTQNDSAVEMLKRNSFLSRITSVCDRTDGSSDESVSPPSLSGEGQGLQASGQYRNGSRGAEVLTPHYSDNTLLLHGYGLSKYQRKLMGRPAHDSSPTFCSVPFPQAALGVSPDSVNRQPHQGLPSLQVSSDYLTSDFYTSYFRRGLSFRMEKNSDRELPLDLSTFRRAAWTSRDEDDDIEVIVVDDNDQRNMPRASGDHLLLEDKVQIIVDSEDDDDVEMIGDCLGDHSRHMSRSSGDHLSLDCVNSYSMQRRLHLPPLRRPSLETPSPRKLSPHKLY